MTFKLNSELVTLKDSRWLKYQKHAGICVSKILTSCENVIKEKTPNLSLIDLENIALEIMKSMDCTPTFLNYRNSFPSAICTSVNKNVVHGIVTEYILQDGDVVSVDLGATFNGAIADAARTFIYGEANSKEIYRMIDTCKNALQAGIDAISIGKRIGAIGNAIHKYTKDSGFKLITRYGGHGISWNKPHDSPFVANRASINDGIRIKPGLAIAIEPMLILGSSDSTKVLEDGWTVEAEGISCHFEDSVFIENDNKIHVLTR